MGTVECEVRKLPDSSSAVEGKGCIWLSAIKENCQDLLLVRIKMATNARLIEIIGHIPYFNYLIKKCLDLCFDANNNRETDTLR